MKVDIPAEAFEQIVIEILKKDLALLDWRPDCGVFRWDEKKDLAKIAKLKKAFRMVLKYYGVNE
jgi:hypothetical protein